MNKFTKKWLILLLFGALTSSLVASENQDSIAELRSGGIIGVGAGGGMSYSLSRASSYINDSGALNAKSNHLMLGLKGGYQHFFNPYFGLRGYGELHYGIPNDKTQGNLQGQALKTSFMMISANIDLMTGFAFGDEKYHGLGVIAGIGLGYVDYKNNYRGNIKKIVVPIPIIPANVGFYYSYKQHTIEFVAKLILLDEFNINSSGSSYGGLYYSSYREDGDGSILMLGYSYAF